jgi:hypothetical protein
VIISSISLTLERTYVHALVLYPFDHIPDPINVHHLVLVHIRAHSATPHKAEDQLVNGRPLARLVAGRGLVVIHPIVDDRRERDIGGEKCV